MNPAGQCRNSAPVVAATPIKTKVNLPVEVSFPIYDGDEGDKFSARLVSVSSGSLTPLSKWH